MVLEPVKSTAMTDQILANLPFITGSIGLISYVYFYFCVANCKLNDQESEFFLAGNSLIIIVLAASIPYAITNGFEIIGKLNEGERIEIVYAGVISWLYMSVFNLRRIFLKTKEAGIKNTSKEAPEKSQPP